MPVTQGVAFETFTPGQDGVFRPFVGGRWLDEAPVPNEVIDPSTGSVVAVGYDGDAGCASAAVAAARAAFDSGPWTTMSVAIDDTGQTRLVHDFPSTSGPADIDVIADLGLVLVAMLWENAVRAFELPDLSGGS